MRVITGTARGRKLQTLPGGDVVRPTSDKVKESMFSIVQFELQDALVLDAFSGSGQLGIEALSRGAEKAYFLDANKNAMQVTQQNLKSTGLFDRSVCLNTDAVTYLRSSKETFDIVLLDPPYNLGILDDVLPLVAAHVSADAWVLCETDSRESLPEQVENLQKYREYKYSKTKLTVYRNNEAML